MKALIQAGESQRDSMPKLGWMLAIVPQPLAGEILAFKFFLTRPDLDKAEEAIKDRLTVYVERFDHEDELEAALQKHIDYIYEGNVCQQSEWDEEVLYDEYPCDIATFGPRPKTEVRRIVTDEGEVDVDITRSHAYFQDFAYLQGMVYSRGPKGFNHELRKIQKVIDSGELPVYENDRLVVLQMAMSLFYTLVNYDTEQFQEKREAYYSIIEHIGELYDQMTNPTAEAGYILRMAHMYFVEELDADNPRTELEAIRAELEDWEWADPWEWGPDFWECKAEGVYEQVEANLD